VTGNFFRDRERTVIAIFMLVGSSHDLKETVMTSHRTIRGRDGVAEIRGNV